jgi:hypothetical protein
VRDTAGTVAENHRLARGEPAYGRRVPALRAVEHHAGTLDQAVAIREEHRRRHATSLPHLSGWIGGHGTLERDVVPEVRTAPPPMYVIAGHSR